MNISKETKQAINAISNTHSIRELFDPVQTHAVYNVSETHLDSVKATLKATAKATRFRIVKTQIKGLVIVCFKIK